MLNNPMLEKISNEPHIFSLMDKRIKKITVEEDNSDEDDEEDSDEEEEDNNEQIIVIEKHDACVEIFNIV
jgi:hypothetical protein